MFICLKGKIKTQKVKNDRSGKKIKRKRMG